MSRLIYADEMVKRLEEWNTADPVDKAFYNFAMSRINEQPTVQLEPLTDREQRIFLAAMGREEKVCKEVDEKYPNREPYEDSLIWVCKEITRKVKSALWTR